MHALTIFKILLLQNPLANYNQTWLKNVFGEGDSNLFKRKARPFSMKEINDRVKSDALTPLKVFSKIPAPISTKLYFRKASLGERDTYISLKGRLCPFPRGDNVDILKIYELSSYLPHYHMPLMNVYLFIMVLWNGLKEVCHIMEVSQFPLMWYFCNFD